MNKTHIILLSVLLLLHAVHAVSQTPQPIPELQEWWRAPADEKGLGEYGVSYIPNFYHGKDAMGVSIKNGQMETWLNRFPGDRENIFTWKGGGPVLQGDFNGDGITDYLGGFIVYRGVKNGEPPDSISVRSFAIRPSLIADVNHDGYDDIVDVGVGARTYGSSYIGQIVYGASDFKAMKVIPFYSSNSIDSTMEMESMYRGADGDMRIILFNSAFQNDPQKFDGYGLYRAKWNKGDTLPTYEKLSSVIRYKDQGTTFNRSGNVYTSTKTSSKYYIAIEDAGMTKNYFIIYNISGDKFEQSQKFQVARNSYPYILKSSINGDEYEDWYISSPNNYFIFFKGGPTLDTVPIFSYQAECNGNLHNLQVIKDVNGDSINDIVTFLESSIAPNCFKILLGPKSTSGVQESSSQTNAYFSLSDPMPHPLHRNTVATFTAKIPTGGVYVVEVLSIVGAKVEEVSRQYMTTGEQTITVDCSHSQASNGTYILRLSNEQGKVVGQRLIVIQ